MNLKQWLYTPLLLLCTGCDMIDYHPYDCRTEGISETNRKHIQRIEKSCAGKDTIRFALISDTQRKYNDTQDMVKHINRQEGIDFVLHGGDISDFGITKEFKWIYDIISGLKVPFVTLIGNHDVLGNGYQMYRSLFGPENFSFMASDVKFVCLNTNAVEYDYSTAIPDFSFMEEEGNDSKARNCRTVVAMHSPPFSEQFNNNVAKPFEAYIRNFNNLQFCVHGHEHNYKVREIFEDGIFYYGCPAVYKREYLVFTITPDNYWHEVVTF